MGTRRALIGGLAAVGALAIVPEAETEASEVEETWARIPGAGYSTARIYPDREPGLGYLDFGSIPAVPEDADLIGYQYAGYGFHPLGGSRWDTVGLWGFEADTAPGTEVRIWFY